MKKTRKIISLLLAMIMILFATAGISFTIYADDESDYDGNIHYVSGDYEYDIFHTGMGLCAMITKYNGTDTDITVPTELDGYFAFYIGTDAFLNCKTLKSIIFPASVSIDYNAFGGCDNLEKITFLEDGSFVNAGFPKTAIIYGQINSSVHNEAERSEYKFVAIDEYEAPFYYMISDDGTAAITLYNGNKKEVVIPENINGYSVTQIKKEAFVNKTNLEKITLPNCLIEIGENAFYNTAYCNNDDNWENGLLYIGKALVDADYYYDFDEIKIKEGTKVIADGIFLDFEINTETIVIPDGVTGIGDAFYDVNFENMIIPASVTNISAYSVGYKYVYWGSEKIENARIYGFSNSAAETYAQENEIEFIAIDKAIISEEAERTYSLGTEGGVSIHCTYPLDKFISVSVNGNVVDENNYTIEEGSTILTFKLSYLNTLEAGKYSVSFNYTLGTVETELIINDENKPTKEVLTEKPSEPTDEKTTESKPAEEEKTANTAAPIAESSEKAPLTGGSSNTPALFAVAAASGFGLLIFIIGTKKRKGEN